MNEGLRQINSRKPFGSGSLPRKVRVAYIINSLNDGGAERQLLELLKHHDRKRFDASLVLMDGRNAERARNLANIFVMGIPAAGNGNWLPRTIRYMRAVHRTRNYIQQWRPDILHAFLPGPCILGGITTLFANVPVFVRSPRSMLDLYRARTLVGAWLDKVFLHRADFNIGNSQAISRELVEIATCPPEKCGTIHNGVDLDKFHPNLSRSWLNSVGWDARHVVFGLVGNFSTAKRHCDFVSAAALIAKKHAGARFVMVGADYGLKSDILQQISACGLEPQFHIADATTQPEPIFAALDVLVSTSETEGFSNVLLEAMACGKPVIATDVGGNKEAVLHGETGFIVPFGSPAAIESAADLLIRNPYLRHRMGTLGRRRAEECFSLQAMTKATEELYLRLVQAA